MTLPGWTPDWHRYGQCPVCGAWAGRPCRRVFGGRRGSSTTLNRLPHRGRKYESLRCAVLRCNLVPAHGGQHVDAAGQSFADYTACDFPNPVNPRVRCQRRTHPAKERHGALIDDGELVMWP